MFTDISFTATTTIPNPTPITTTTTTTTTTTAVATVTSATTVITTNPGKCLKTSQKKVLKFAEETLAF